MKRAILLTGFTPFGSEDVNPSWEAVRALDGTLIGGHRVHAVRLPTEFGASLPALRAALRSVDPRVAIAVGLAGGRSGLSLERVAINVIDARIPDNAGAQPIDVPVIRGRPAAYFTTLPIKRALLALRDAGLPAHVSQTAGTYVCNQVFYALLDAARRRSGLRAGFVHVPYLPGQGRRLHQPSMPLDDMVRAIGIVARAALTKNPRDTAASAGAES